MNAQDATVMEVAKTLQQSFRSGYSKLAGRAGWKMEDFPGLAWLAAHEACMRHKGEGQPVGLAWKILACQAGRAGWSPPAVPWDDIDQEEEPLDELDPLRHLEIGELACRLSAFGLLDGALHREGMSSKTTSRRIKKAKQLAQDVLQGRTGPQLQLDWG